MVYGITVHLFVAGSSPGCAKYGLKKTVDDYEQQFCTEAANFIRNETAQSPCQQSSRRPNLSNKPKGCVQEVACDSTSSSPTPRKSESIPPEDRAKGLKDIDLRQDIHGAWKQTHFNSESPYKTSHSLDVEFYPLSVPSMIPWDSLPLFSWLKSRSSKNSAETRPIGMVQSLTHSDVSGKGGEPIYSFWRNWRSKDATSQRALEN